MKKYIKNIIISSIIIFVGLGLVLSPEVTRNGAYKGIMNSINIIIPSLFPFIVLTVFVEKSNFAEKIFYLPAKILSKTFKIDIKYCIIFFLGILGGYPAAANIISYNLSKKQIKKDDAETLLCFCTGAGPSFLVSAVGSGMFLSKSIGIILLESSILSSFTLLLIYKSKLSGKISNTTKKETNCISLYFVDSVKVACKSVSLISSMVIIFSVISSFFKKSDKIMFKIIYGITEVTQGVQGVTNSQDMMNIILASMFCGFGGLCIIFQIMAICSSENISIKRFVLSRIINSILNATFTFLLLMVTPIETNETFISNSQKITLQNPLCNFSAFMMLFCCILFPVCITERKKYNKF